MSDRVFVMMTTPVGETIWTCDPVPEDLHAALVSFASAQTDCKNVVEEYNIKVKLVSRHAFEDLPEFEGW